MKTNRLPLYVLFVLVGVAIVWRIANPPAPALPGPVGIFPAWKSIATLGDLGAQATNPGGTMWAGAWNQKLPDGKMRSGVRIIKFLSYTQKSTGLPEGASTQYLSWADDTKVRALCSEAGKNAQIVYIDGATGERKQDTRLNESVERVLAWPSASDMIAVVLDGNDKTATLAVLSESGKDVVGKEIKFDIPKDGEIVDGGGVALDGSAFVFCVSDPAAKDGKAYYIADTAAGTAKKAFDLAAVPGRIEGIWPSKDGMLLVCSVKDKLEDVTYDPATGKLTEQPNGIGDVAKYPGAPKSIAKTNYDGGFEFDVANGKSKVVLDMSKRNSEGDKHWRDFLRDSRLYKLSDGNFVTVAETGGAMDIREIKPDGSIYRAYLSRM